MSLNQKPGCDSAGGRPAERSERRRRSVGRSDGRSDGRSLLFLLFVSSSGPPFFLLFFCFLFSFPLFLPSSLVVLPPAPPPPVPLSPLFPLPSLPPLPPLPPLPLSRSLPLSLPCLVVIRLFSPPLFYPLAPPPHHHHDIWPGICQPPCLKLNSQ